MCGITGIIRNNPFQRDILETMTDTLSHRGPDDRGIFYQQKDSLCIGLGQRRLSIIDLSHQGQQPMSDSSKNYWITYNGEFYNYLEIKKELLSKGYKFKSETDTEVFLYGYIEYGTDVFNKINGMFAVAIWDNQKNELILARDRFGQKPLYYYLDYQGISFASELKSLLTLPNISKEIDIKSLSKYLAFEYLPTPFSIIKGVNKLEQGSYLKLRFTKGSIKKEHRTYWEINLRSNLDIVSSLSQTQLEEKIISLLKKSIKRRLMSDVPLGVFLSGGIDSSSIVALLSEMMNPREIKTFSIGFEEKSFNETNYASKIARIFKTDHHEQILNLDKMLQIFPEVIEKLDEPYADASIIPTYLLSKFTQKHVTVALGGDAGDELFAGYDPFLANYWANYYENIPRIIHDKIIHPLARKMPVSTENMSLDFKIKHFLKGVYNEPAIRNQIWLGSYDKNKQKQLLSKEVLDNVVLDPFSQIENELSNQTFSDTTAEIAHMYQKFYLADDILVKIDRASMMNSLEARTPFLDVELAEFANSLPSHLKIKKTVRKYILKKALEGRLPKSILYRNKKGFGIPLAKWINKDLKKEIQSTFEPAKIKREGLFQSDYIQSLLKQHFSGKRDNRKEIWTLFMFEKWREKYA